MLRMKPPELIKVSHTSLSFHDISQPIIRCVMKWTSEEIKREKQRKREQKLTGGEEATRVVTEGDSTDTMGGGGGGADGDGVVWEGGDDPEEATLLMIDQAVIHAHAQQLTKDFDGYVEALSFEGAVKHATDSLLRRGERRDGCRVTQNMISNSSVECLLNLCRKP